MSDFIREKKIPDETRMKISVSLKGRDLGKIIPEEQRENLGFLKGPRLRQKNKITGEKCASPEGIRSEMIILVGQTDGKGTPHSDDTKRKIRDSQEGLFTAVIITTGIQKVETREEFNANPNLRGFTLSRSLAFNRAMVDFPNKLGNIAGFTVMISRRAMLISRSVFRVRFRDDVVG